MYDSLLEGKETLQEMAISGTAAIDPAIKRILLDDMFWDKVTSSLTILRPIAAAIMRIEGDSALLSDVQHLFTEMKEAITAALPTSLLQRAEETAVIKALEKRQTFCLKPIHAAAYMLDPKYRDGGGMLSGEDTNSANSHNLNSLPLGS